MAVAEPAVYRIRVQGRLDPPWPRRMGGLAVEVDASRAQPVTTLTGELVDQSALHGVLHTLFELHLPLLSAERLSNR